MFFFSSRRRHTSCALVTEFRRVLFRSAPDDKLFSIFRSLPELAIRPPMSVRYACSGAFSSIRYRGKVFVINPSCQLDESVSLTGIIAARLGSELERLALMQQAAETARSDRTSNRLNSSH